MSIVKQYEQAKADHPDKVLLFRVGDFWETFREDAETVVSVCKTARTVREPDGLVMTGFPHSQLEPRLKQLLGAGRKVALAEPV